ncbi:Levodione reductase [Delftia tsuruhatensis]|uniref:SDR family NAD(P)-dependent oxidoreductase n=1 Tax=Delftia tsuruhatensis TaxID=180282 RepID=UPI001E6C2ABE|nr:SDR family NAD(P)-dependent oxidoreductase [Delftia tsuruhatensis]CAB5671373.1 Levodione reductase [Delftia tsuruhatensis]CAC9683205.1 Levodione reductase [Delftia tsuruhatensis]
MNSSSEKNALVIGGASGIGLAVTERLQAAGHRVRVADLNAAQLSQLGQRLGCETVPLDVRQPEQVAQTIAWAARDGALDIAINCAGIEGEIDFLVHQDDEMLKRVMDTNSLGLLYALKYEMRQMMRQGHGLICSVASIYGLSGQTRWAAYCASKHAVVGATKAAALEVAHLGIRVNAVAPGPILTPLLERATGGDIQRPANYVPMRSLGAANDIAQAITWLCSEEARYVTGAVLSVDGGVCAQTSTTPDFSQSQFRL